jgi:phage RecT family recombinase
VNTVARATPAQPIALSTDEHLKTFLLARKGEFDLIAKSTGVDTESLVMELVVAARKNPAILTCTPNSIIAFVHSAARCGLVVGRGIFPVPLRDNKKGVFELNAWVGARGLAELVVYGKGARLVYSYVVFEGDPFEEKLGLYPDIVHTRGPNAGNMSKIVGAYAVAVISQTIRKHKYLTRQEIERYRRMSRNADRGPWVEHYDKMCEKTAVLRLCGDLPQNPRLAFALKLTEEVEGLKLGADDIEGEAPPPPRDLTPPAGTTEQSFEEFHLPRWRDHPLAGMALSAVKTDDLEALYEKLYGSSYEHVRTQIALELDERRAGT